MARTKSKKRLVGTWSTQQRREAMEQSREAARGPVDLPFLLLTLLLTAMGMVMVLSASFPSAYYENNGNGAYYFVRQGIFAVLGLAAMFGLSKMNYQRLRGVGRLLLWGSILLLVLVAHRLDLALGASYVRDGVCIAFTVSEVISIAENAGLMGVPLPAVLERALEALKDKANPKD